MAFPSNPTNGQRHTESGVIYEWISSYGVWDLVDPNQSLVAGDVLTAVKTVDGAGSGLDADTLDGLTSGNFLRSDATTNFDSQTGSRSLNITRLGSSNEACKIYTTDAHTAFDAVQDEDAYGGFKFKLDNVSGHDYGAFKVENRDNVRLLTINSLGNVGVGTGGAAPGGRLHVKGGRIVVDHTSDQQTGIQFNASGTEMAVLYRSSNNTDRMHMYLTGAGNVQTWRNNGRVGINTDNPSNAMEVAFTGDDGLKIHNTGSSHASLYIDRPSGSTGNYIRMAENGTAKYWLNESGGNLLFRPNGGTTKVTFQNGGKAVFEDHIEVGPGNASSGKAIRTFQKYISTGSSAATHRIAIYSRHWWGSGNMRVKLYDNYYGPNSYYREYTIDGHTRVSHGGGQPSANLRVDHGGHCSVNTSSWDSTNQRANVNVYTPAYRGTWCIVELTNYSTSVPTGAANSVWLDGFTEIL